MSEALTNTADASADAAADASQAAPDNGADTSTLAVETTASTQGTPATRDRDEAVDKDIDVSRQRAENADDAIERAARAALENKGVEEIEEAYQNEPDDEQVEESKPKEPVAGVPTPKPGDLSESDANMLKRWALESDDLPKNAERREKFLAGLRMRTEFTDRLASGQPNETKEGAAPQGQGGNTSQATDAQAALDAAIAKHGKPLTEFFGNEVGAPMAKALVSIAQELFGPAQQAANAFYASLEARDTEDGMMAARTNLADVKLVEADITKKAWELIHAKRAAEGQAYNPMRYNLRQAIPEAANLLYQQDAKKAAAVALAKRGQQALRGSPARGTRTPTGTPKMTEDDRLTAAAQAALAGKGAKAAQLAAYGQ